MCMSEEEESSLSEAVSSFSPSCTTDPSSFSFGVPSFSLLSAVASSCPAGL